ncbi:hypothetical protein MN116_008187 [Schistosoma mekongi]|uniref:RRM domain-containing protein n=1 Tax=Schistosoma mekongi TaxID=38744 RepID=A0AAE1Z6Z3_SCHME|nr:hypothetical protein MN116_008187 [Schistosoma mekongi]
MQSKGYTEVNKESNVTIVKDINNDYSVNNCVDLKHKSSDNHNDEENGPSTAKRQCLSDVDDVNNRTSDINNSNNNTMMTNVEFKYWLVLTVVTTGKQGSELGSDQTPLIQFNGILGNFFTNKIVDRINVTIRPEHFTPNHHKSIHLINSKSHLQSYINTSNEPKSDNYILPHWNNKINQLSPPMNILKSIPGVESTRYTSTTAQYISISTEALEAAGLQNISECENHNLTFKELIIKIMNWLHDHGAFNNVLVNNKSSILLITENHQSIRNVLHAEAAYRSLDNELMNRSPWLMYVDIVKCCQEFLLQQSNSSNHENYVNDKEIIEQQRIERHQLHDIFEAAHALQVKYEETKVAIVKAEIMANIVVALNIKGYQVKNPEYVHYNYEHKTFSRKLKMDDNQVVEIRQVPWSATPSTIAHYFAGLNVHPGGVAIRLTDGRRSNTAIVAFNDSMNAQLALARNQHHLYGSLTAETMNSPADVNNTSSLTNHELIHNNNSTNTSSDKNNNNNNNNNNNQSCINNRSECPTDGIQQIVSTSMKPMYLQIHSASGREFIQCAGCDQECVTNFLNQLTNGEQVVVRVRGLPYTTTKKQIIEFFNVVQAPVMLDEQGIYLVVYPDRRPTGDAFVLFNDDQIATKALIRHKDYLGDRYVELFKASPSEMVQVCYNVTLFHGSPSGQKTHFGISGYQSNGMINGGAPTNCFNVVNYINNNTANSINNNEAYFSTAFIHLKPSTDTRALSNIQNLWNSREIPLSLPHNLLTPSGIGLNSPVLNGSVMRNEQTFGVSASMPIVPSNNLPVHFNLISSIGATNPFIRDLTDPTDPECPFARTLPVGGTCAMVQMNELPMETSRHDIRLYLGPANFAKVYRMKRMETVTNSNTSTWLLSLRNTSEAVQFIRDLISRSFTITTLGRNNSQQFKVIPNIPKFTLYAVNQNGKLSVVNLTDNLFGIPIERIHSTSWLNWSQKSIKLPIKANCDEQNMLNAVTSQIQFYQPTLALKPTSFSIKNFDVSNFINSISSLHLSPTVNQQDYKHLSSSSNLLSSCNTINSNISLNFKPTSHGNNNSNVSVQYNLPSFTESIVMLAGAPADATHEELLSLFNPVKNLLTAQPYFVPFQYQSNGTAIFLASFNNPLDAQTAVHYCPNGSLRSNKYVVGAACLIPSTSTTSYANNITTSSPMSPINTTNLLTLSNLINFPGILPNNSLTSGVLLLPSTPTVRQNRLNFP